MTHAQKPVFVFRRNGRVHLNRRGTSVQSTTGSRSVLINGSNVGYTMFRGSVKGTGYPLHLPLSPSLPLPCVIVRHHISNGVYNSEPFVANVNAIWYWWQKPIPVGVRCKAYVCGRLIPGIAASNPAEGMDVCFLCLLCVV